MPDVMSGPSAFFRFRSRLADRGALFSRSRARWPDTAQMRPGPGAGRPWNWTRRSPTWSQRSRPRYGLGTTRTASTFDRAGPETNTGSSIRFVALLFRFGHDVG